MKCHQISPEYLSHKTWSMLRPLEQQRDIPAENQEDPDTTEDLHKHNQV